LREQDGSRWKAVVPLATAWNAYRLHAGQFVSYANEKLGRADSAIQPRELNRLLLGMTAAMAGPGRHAFELRGLRLETAAAPTELVARTAVFAGAEREVARWFGVAVRLPPRQPAMDQAAWPAQRWQCRRLVGAAGAPALAGGPLAGRFAGTVTGASQPAGATPLSPRLELAARLRSEQAIERLPLLRTERRFATASQEVAALLFYREGLLAGGRWLCLGLETPDPAAHPGLAAFLADSLRLARTAVLCDSLRPRFRAVGTAVRLDVLLQARNPTFHELHLPLRVQVTLAGEVRHEAQVLAHLPGEPGTVTECVLAEGIPISGREWLELELHAAATDPETPAVGRMRFRLAAREALEQVAEYMLEQAADDAKLAGFSFIDNRGMRALLAASDIFGRKDFRKTAWRWGEAMLSEQRADGGYRMGYGITAKGEECYVADGGEIAVAIARLTEYSQGRQRQALIRSLDAYMGFRDSFRVPGGGIGVGWCLQDYGQRPVLPLDEPIRILAPELNTYTIGCSLAAAYLHAALFGSTPLATRAAKDADWLMGRTPRLNGAFVESFQYAHALSRDRTQRAIYADYIGRAFSIPMKEAAAAGRSWWLAGEGRSALNLGGLAYVLDRFGDDPELRAETMRATCLMFSPDSPESVLSAIRQPVLGQDGWIYVCYGTLGLVDVIKPLVSMDGSIAQP
jgi:hypothetical protein